MDNIVNLEFEVDNQTLKINTDIEDLILLFNTVSETETPILTFGNDDSELEVNSSVTDFNANEQVLEYDSDINDSLFSFDNANDDESIFEVTTDETNEERLLNYNYNQYNATFKFNTGSDSVWTDVDKFAIFVDSWGNPCIIHLGDEAVVECTVPSTVLNGNYFKVSVYGGDLVSTNNVVIPLEMSGYIDYIDSNNPNNINTTHKDIFVEIFEEIDNMVNTINYHDNCLQFCGNDGVITLIYLPFITETECRTIINELETRINNQLDTKVDNDTISTVGLTGDYNDLNNIPSNFTPSTHTHTVSDVTDFEENTGVEIKRAYNVLINQIRRYGE